MNTPPIASASIRHNLGNAREGPPRFLSTVAARVCLADLLDRTTLGGRAAELAGRSVLIAARDQYAAALALIELDGLARRLILCPPDLASKHLPAVVAGAGVEAVVSDQPTECGIRTVEVRIQTPTVEFPVPNSQSRIPTEWVLLTSGTTGAPRMLAHHFASLTAPFRGAVGRGAGVVWGTFYDLRRYGGLQIFLRAVLGGGSFVLAGCGESIGDYLARLAAHGATHVSGTPSHWRRALMSPEARAIAPRYIRLSGEIADQGILNALRAFYPQASIGQAFASTEAGVGFEVDDGLEGFPASIVGAPGDVQVRVDDGSLRIRSARQAVCRVGDEPSAIAADDGFVDTGDMVERRGDRYYFLGRRSGIINVGGLKVHPEEVEATINRHPAVRVSMVRSIRSPMTGSLVAADVVLSGEPAPTSEESALMNVTREILQICRESLAPHKIPATIRFVPALEIGTAGKLARHA
jgi:acyl-CoA synthetase (AMP-forming)/AMP-acid ligase II